jgi:hypothetical protein
MVMLGEVLSAGELIDVGTATDQVVGERCADLLGVIWCAIPLRDHAAAAIG